MDENGGGTPFLALRSAQALNPPPYDVPNELKFQTTSPAKTRGDVVTGGTLDMVKNARFFAQTLNISCLETPN